MTITQSGFNNPGDTITLTLNGQTLAGANTLSELSTMINGFRSSTLPAINADIDVSGNLIITSEIGQDLVMGIDSPVVTDSIVVQGAQGTGPVTLGGNSSADQAASVGGSVEFTLNEGYTMQNPVPSVTGIFSSLTPTDFTGFTINAFDPENQDTYNYATSINIFDSLGNSHVMTQFMVREPADPSRPTAQNLWNMYVLVDGQDVGDPDPTLPFPQNLEPTRSRHELFFNTDGSLNTDSTQDILISNWDPLDENGVPTGALGSLNILEGGILPVQEPPVSSNFEVVLEGSTQYGAAFGVTDRAQDGYTTGRLSGLDVSDEGVIFARYTNGQAQTLGQVAIAGFRAPEGLIPQGSTMWSESYESGDPSVGTPGSSSFGSIRSSSLEDSNVDLSEELVGLIIAQRNFQASAKTIETADAITQTIINLR
jgi:flagellar hook protein FlgE